MGVMKLDEEALAKVAGDLFEGAVPAKKKAEPVAVLQNISQETIQFNVVLADGKKEVEFSSIPSGGYAVVQKGGEINVQPDFKKMYEGLEHKIDKASSDHADTAMTRAGIAVKDALAKHTAVPKSRVDHYLKLPLGENGQSIGFSIKKSWGEQGAKSGDVLVCNTTSGTNDVYFNSVDGTLGGFVHALTGEPVKDILQNMKTVPLEVLMNARDVSSGEKRKGREGECAEGSIAKRVTQRRRAVAEEGLRRT